MKKMLVLVLLVSSLMMPRMSHAQSYDYYKVQKGDSLWRISVKYEVGLSEIINANPQIKNPALIYPGETVKVPLITATKKIEQEAVRLTNVERQKQGLAPLTLNWELARVARYKARDMRDNHYFSHTSPTYGSPFTMIKNFGIQYRSAAENIAAGQQTAQAVMNAWMNSSGHRANILNAGYTQIGVGYAQGGSYGAYWSQMFISK